MPESEDIIGIPKEIPDEVNNRLLDLIGSNCLSTSTHISQTSTTEEPRRWNVTRKQVIIFILIIYGNFWIATCYSVIAPFFPNEAKKKGASATIYGFIFGIFQLTRFIASLIYGKIMPPVTPKFFIISGMFFTSICSILFGVLYYSPNGIKFIVLSFVVRIFEALGSSAYYVSSLTMAAEEFPNKRATVLAIFESVSAIGNMAGPTIGGALYQAGGYFLPFVALGGFILIGTVIGIFIIPSLDREERTSNEGFLTLMKHPSFYSHCCVFTYSAVLIGYIDATLASHLDQFNLSPTLVGLVFSVPALIYAIGTPIWGYLCDKVGKPYLFCIIGSISCTVAFLLIGPVPFLKLKATLWMVIVSLILYGIGISAMLISSFIVFLAEVINLGFPNDTSTYALISGIFASAISLGTFIGPSAGGLILDSIGYENGTVILMGISCLMVIVIIMNCICSKPTNSNFDNSEDRQPIVVA